MPMRLAPNNHIAHGGMGPSVAPAGDVTAMVMVGLSSTAPDELVT